MADKTFTLTDNTNNTSVVLPVREGTQGPPTVEISTLYREMGVFTYDPGFMSTASCNSAITYIDGEAGVLEYRGYPIDQLADESHFLEVAYLLLYSELPGQEEMEKFEDLITHHTMIKENLKDLFNGFHYDAHPMAIMTGVVGSLSAFYHDSLDIYNPKHREISAHRIIAKMPTIAAACFKHSKSEPFVYPRNDMGFSENFLHMMFSTPCEEYVPDPIAVKAIDVLFTLHADHEQNASTSTVRLAGSSQANPFACIAAGIASLWGPAHGGANEAVLDMLETIGDVSQVDKFILKAKDKNDPFRLMGFGHRVYKNYDPRARIVRDICRDLLKATGQADSPLMALAMRLEEIALEDEYFIQHKLYPNVDFYSGIIYRALGIPNNMFTVMFAIARSVGWIAHWMEMIAEPGQKIGRPRQVYDGALKRDYVPAEKR